MSRKACRTPRQLNAEQKGFILSQLKGRPLKEPAFEEFSRSFERTFGFSICLMAVRRLLKQNSNGHDRRLSKIKVNVSRLRTRRSYQGV